MVESCASKTVVCLTMPLFVGVLVVAVEGWSGGLVTLLAVAVAPLISLTSSVDRWVAPRAPGRPVRSPS